MRPARHFSALAEHRAGDDRLEDALMKRRRGAGLEREPSPIASVGNPASH